MTPLGVEAAFLRARPVLLSRECNSAWLAVGPVWMCCGGALQHCGLRTAPEGVLQCGRVPVLLYTHVASLM